MSVAFAYLYIISKSIPLKIESRQNIFSEKLLLFHQKWIYKQNNRISLFNILLSKKV